LLGAVTLIAGCSKENSPQTKKEPVTEKVGFAPKEETPTEKVGSTLKKIDKIGEPAAQEVADFSDKSHKINVFTITLKKGLEKKELEMVLVPAGKFKMGFSNNDLENFRQNAPKKEKKGAPVAPAKKDFKSVETIVNDKDLKKEIVEEDFEEADRKKNILKGMQHEVTITKPFYIGKYEVTQEQWETVMGNNPSETEGEKLPVTNVSWEDCQDFIKKLNLKTDGGYRLPTEAEWEYACRAGTTTFYSFGNKFTHKDANYRDLKIDKQIDKPVAVGSYKANAFGLFDMHGNVWEWCEDRAGDYSSESVGDPKGPATGEYRVLRGGSFFNIGNYNSFLWNRWNEAPPTTQVNSIGFRLAKDK